MLRMWLACALSAGALAACDSDDEKATGPAADTRAVAATVEALETALRRRDFGRVCREIFTSAVREEAGGRACPSMLRRTARGLRNPRIDIRSVAFERGRATALVTTRATGQAPAPDEIRLVMERGRWRVAALGG